MTCEQKQIEKGHIAEEHWRLHKESRLKDLDEKWQLQMEAEKRQCQLEAEKRQHQLEAEKLQQQQGAEQKQTTTETKGRD